MTCEVMAAALATAYRPAMTLLDARPHGDRSGKHRPVTPGAGPLLRSWRQRRRLSQLELACEAEVSTRHLSYVETGRARPSRAFVLHLAELTVEQFFPADAANDAAVRGAAASG